MGQVPLMVSRKYVFQRYQPAALCLHVRHPCEFLTSYSKTSRMLESTPIGDDASVWVLQNDPKLCVVGMRPLEELVHQEMLSIFYLSWPLIPLWVVLSFRTVVGGAVGVRSDGYVLVQKDQMA